MRHFQTLAGCHTSRKGNGTSARYRPAAGLEMILKVRKGDIVIAPFQYTETEERKIRPCLVFDTTAVSVLLICITSQKLVEAFETEVVLSEQESAAIGLTKKSKIDFMKRDIIPIQEVRRTVGHISALPRSVMARCYLAAKAARLLEE